MRARRERAGGGGGRRGFSLFEVLVAISVLAALSGVVYAFLADMARQRERAAELARQLQAGIVLIERLETDVLSSLAGTGSVGAGVEGTNERLKLLSRGVTPPMGEGQAAAPLGDLQVTEFEFGAASGELRASHGDAHAETGAEMQLLADGLERVRFRYHDGRNWVASFDSMARGGLPVAIEVALWFEPTGERDAEPSEPGDAASPDASDGEPVDGPGRGVPPIAPRFLDAPGPPEQREIPTRAPDRLRIIVVPDGPEVDSGVGARDPSGSGGAGAGGAGGGGGP